MEHQQTMQLIHNNKINHGASLAWENSQTVQQTYQKYLKAVTLLSEAENSDPMLA